MGKLEKEAKEQRRRDYVQQAVLATIAVSGMLAVAVVAPNTLQLLGHLNKRFKYRSDSVLSRLAAKGLVRFYTDKRGKHVALTDAGKRAVAIQQEAAALRAGSRKRWDKRWRMVMFDISEHRKSDRDYLRRLMIESGFELFQDSVWIYPYDCEELVTLIKIERRFGNAVRYAIVEKLENDTEFRSRFNLK